MTNPTDRTAMAFSRRLALAACLISGIMVGGEANAAAIDSSQQTRTFAYSTYGSVGNGPNSSFGLSFDGVEFIDSYDYPYSTASTFQAPGSITLGRFVADPLPAGSSVSLGAMPFTVSLRVSDTPDRYLWDNHEFIISGMLNGTLAGDGTSDLIAEVTSISSRSWYGNPPFAAESLEILPQVIIAAGSGSYSVGTPLMASISIVPVPEPTALATIGLSVLAIAVRARRRRRARRAG